MSYYELRPGDWLWGAETLEFPLNIIPEDYPEPDNQLGLPDLPKKRLFDHDSCFLEDRIKALCDKCLWNFEKACQRLDKHIAFLEACRPRLHQSGTASSVYDHATTSRALRRWRRPEAIAVLARRWTLATQRNHKDWQVQNLKINESPYRLSPKRLSSIYHKLYQVHDQNLSQM